MFFFVETLHKIARFIVSFFTGNRQRRDCNTLDRHPLNQEDRGKYETLNGSPAPSNNHWPCLASAEIRIGIDGGNYEKSSPSNSTSKVGKLPEIPVSVQPRITVDSRINNNNSAQIKPESIKRLLDEPHEVYLKPKGLAPLPPPPRVLQSKSTDPGTQKPVDLSLSDNRSPFSSQPPPFSFKPAPSSSQTPRSSSDSPLRPSSIQPPPFSFKPAPSSTQTPRSSSDSPLRPSSIQPPQFSCDPPSSSSRLPPSASKPTLSPLPSNPTNPQTKANYVLVQKGTSPIYEIPEDIKDLIKKDVVPRVLKKPLSPLTYKDYFAALLFAEDFYIEKWSNFKLKNKTLDLHQAEIYNKSNKNRKLNVCDEKDEKIFVAFEIDSVPERRPFLLSRDFVFARPSHQNIDPFQGIIYRVVKSNLVLVEFGEDFLSHYYSTCKYDVSFSFNRVCLKRAHQAIAAASDPLFQNFLFPDCVSRKSFLTSSPPNISSYELDLEQKSVIRQILSLKGPPPYLIEGPLSVTNDKQLSRTGLFVREAVLQIYRAFPKCRILISAPINSTCDVMMRSLKREIPETDMFRANAAFRELDEVPDDILPSCLYKGECFTCPSLQELRNFKVILSTFVSGFRLSNEGINSGHFSHIFLVDASSATEPETMVALANLANEKTVVVLTGAPRNHSGWVRSVIGRKNGLVISYFERLWEQVIQ